MEYLEEIGHHFGYLVDNLGFEIISHSFDPQSFGNLIIVYRRGDLQLRLVKDRSQVFIEFSLDSKCWYDKERILEALGVSMSRYRNDEIGLWEGYKIENQGAHLREHFDLIEKYLKSGGVV
jgi:hypothetical protein